MYYINFRTKNGIIFNIGIGRNNVEKAMLICFYQITKVYFNPLNYFKVCELKTSNYEYLGK